MTAVWPKRFVNVLLVLVAIPAMEDRAIHSSISWKQQGAENISMEYSPPIIPMLLALISFITASAFQSGKRFQDDSDSVV